MCTFSSPPKLPTHPPRATCELKPGCCFKYLRPPSPRPDRPTDRPASPGNNRGYRAGTSFNPMRVRLFHGQHSANEAIKSTIYCTKNKNGRRLRFSLCVLRGRSLLQNYNTRRIGTRVLHGTIAVRRRSILRAMKVRGADCPLPQRSTPKGSPLVKVLCTSRSRCAITKTPPPLDPATPAIYPAFYPAPLTAPPPFEQMSTASHHPRPPCPN